MAEDSRFRNMLNNGRRTRRVETLSMSAASALESTGGASSGSKLKQLFLCFPSPGSPFPEQLRKTACAKSCLRLAGAMTGKCTVQRALLPVPVVLIPRASI